MWIYINKVTVRLHVCVSYFLIQFDQFWIWYSDCDTYTNGATKDILSVSNTYTIGATLPVSPLEQIGALVPLKF